MAFVSYGLISYLKKKHLSTFCTIRYKWATLAPFFLYHSPTKTWCPAAALSATPDEAHRHWNTFQWSVIRKREHKQKSATVPVQSFGLVHTWTSLFVQLHIQQLHKNNYGILCTSSVPRGPIGEQHLTPPPPTHHRAPGTASFLPSPAGKCWMECTWRWGESRWHSEGSWHPTEIEGGTCWPRPLLAAKHVKVYAQRLKVCRFILHKV